MPKTRILQSTDGRVRPLSPVEPGPIPAELAGRGNATSGNPGRVARQINNGNPLLTSPSAETDLVTLRNVKFSYGKRQILGGIDLAVPRGKVVAIMAARVPERPPSSA
jgi:ABC-type multidrug transport system fused ATPase/permease subunit